MDILQGEEIIDWLFVFKESKPLSRSFDLYGFNNKNFMLNSGSYFLLQIIIVVQISFMSLLHRLLKVCYRSWTARSISLWVYTKDYWQLAKNALQKLFIESYFDLLFCSILNVVALIQSQAEDGSIYEHFSTWHDVLNSSLTILYSLAILILPVYWSSLLMMNFSDLDTPDFREKHEVLYSEVKVKTRP